MKDFHFCKLLKVISISLIVALLLQVVPLGAFAVDTTINDTIVDTQESEPLRIAEVLYEDETRREETVKHFKMDDGTYAAVEYSNPVHYLNENGEYLEIDNTLETVTLSDGTSGYVNKENNFSVTLPNDISNNREIVISKNGKKISFAVDGAGNSKGIVDNNTDEEKAEELEKELEKATSEQEKTKIRNKYAYAVDKNESMLTYAYNGYIDVEYKLIGNKLKESLIIKKQTGKADFKFKYDFDCMTAELQDDNSVLVKDGDEIIFIIEAPYMFDSAENYSSNITVEIKNKNKGFEYILHADKDWLKSSDRVYPVTIDPTIVATAQSDASKIKSGTGAKTGLDASDLAALAENGNTLKVGYVYGTNVSAVYYAPIPSSIPKSARVTAASLFVICSNAPSSAFPVYLSRATKNWAKGTIALTGDDFPDVSSLEQTYIMSPTAGTTYEFDITEIAQAWHCGEYANYGIVLHTDSAGTTQNFAAFYSNTASGKKPYYVYTYADTKGVEGYWSYSTVGLAKGGVASINQFTGYVSAEIPLLSTESQKLPFNLSLVYDGYSANTNTYSLSTCGLGMKLNIDQRIINLDTSSLEYANGYLYKYRDTDGTDIYLKRSTENSVSHDRDELGYGYDATIVGSDWKLLDRNDNYVMFNSAGCVKSIYSAEKKASVTVTYDPNNQYRISKITDASGNNLTITRNDNWYVTRIADDFKRYVDFTYTSNRLTKLTYYDGTVVNFTYEDDGMLSKVTGSDNTGVKFNYYSFPSSSSKYYLTNRISSVNEFYTASSTDTAGNSISFTYNSGNSTTITDTKGIKTTYVFDNWGRVTSAYNDHGSAYTDYQNPPSDTTKPATSTIHQLYKDVSLEKPVNNLLTNHSFEDGATNWEATTGATVVSTQSYVGYKSLKIVGASGSYRRMLQNVTIPEDGTYTLSAFVKIANAAANRVQLRIYEDGEVIKKVSFGYTNGSWQRVEVSADLDASKSHLVSLVVQDTTCTAYFDAVQFEKADSANHYNLLENTTFKNNASSWDTTYTSSGSGTVTYTGTDATRPSFIKEGYKIVGHYNSNYAITQTVKINKPASTLALDLSAYSKANSVPNGLRENVLYSLCIKFVYEDSSGTKVGEELQFVTFNSDSSSWQNAAKPFIPSKTWRDSDYNVQYVCVYFQYYRNCNEAEVSNIVLNFDSSGNIYDYDGNGNLTSVRSLKDGKVYENVYNLYNEMTQSKSELGGTWEYDYCDNNNHLLETATHQELGYKVTYSYSSNLLTGTTFGSENTSKVITTSQSYSANNRHIASVTDAAGTTATYTYDDDTDRLTSIVSGSAQTSYSYDDYSERVKKVTSKISSSKNAVVNYTYDSAKRLSTITRGGNVYTITYDSWGNQKAVKVGSSTLSTNTYASGNGNLTKTTYGDGTYVNYVYDELDRLVSKKVNGTTQFTQVYNNSGDIGKYKDNVTGVTWTYNYDKIGRLRDIFGSNGNKYKYVFNSKNLISMKKYEVSGSAVKVDYTYTAQGVPKTATYDSNKLTRTLDSLGRVSTLVTKTSADVNLTTSYSYYNYGTNNTTTRLSSVTNPMGTYNYTYDSLGNVTGISGALTRSYTYDSLGQLTSVTAGSSTTNITYDTNGNILTRGDDVYTYGNANWPDQLTAYNGRTYTYDAIGNATSWRLGMTFTWQKGRQLASVTRSSNTYNYTYDSSGVRTSKTVGGVTTNFTYVDGKLIHQTDGTNVWWFYYDSDGSLMAMEYNDAMYFYQFDGLGNIVGLVDVNGAVVASYVYDAWGRATTRTGSMSLINPFRFKGYYYDDETQFYYLMSRYYDPIVGRFINADSFASTGQGVLGYNMYAYCGNNPVMYVDATGKSATVIFVVLGLFALVGGIWGASLDYNLLDSSSVKETQPEEKYTTSQEPPLAQSSPINQAKQYLLEGRNSHNNQDEPTFKSSSNRSSKQYEPSDFVETSQKNDVTTGDRVVNTLIGAGLGLGIGGALMATGGAAATLLGYGSVAVAGVTSLEVFAWGSIAFDVFAMLVAPILGMEVEPIEV